MGAIDPIAYGSSYRIGSTTKPFVATVILQLVGEHKLNLDDPVELGCLVSSKATETTGRGSPCASCCSRLVDCLTTLADPTFFSTLATPEAFAANRYNDYSQRQLVQIAISRRLSFAPGARFEYSNTNYVLADMVTYWPTWSSRRSPAMHGMCKSSAASSTPWA